LILPMVMLFTVMMIFLAFYSYDRCILEHSAYEAALRWTSSHFKTAGEASICASACPSTINRQSPRKSCLPCMIFVMMWRLMQEV